VFTAVVRISGTGRLADFRERLRWLMVRDADAEDYTEHHAEGVLEYRFEPKKGIPFPAFAAASGDFPELRVEASWERDGVRGRAVIENGKVSSEERGESPAPGLEIDLGERGELRLGMVIEKHGDGWRGYAATAAQHTFFQVEGGRARLLDVDSPDDELEALAFGFVDEWIWYDEEEAAVERTRYNDYGYPVRGANLRSEKLALLRRDGAGRHSTLDEGARAARDALLREWPTKA
jgi:hypothetical protein